MPRGRKKRIEAEPQPAAAAVCEQEAPYQESNEEDQYADQHDFEVGAFIKDRRLPMVEARREAL